MLDLATLTRHVSGTPAWLQSNPDFRAFVETLSATLAAPDKGIQTAGAAISQLEEQVAWVDGSFIGHGKAGWAVVFETPDGSRSEISAPMHEPTVTNQRAEIRAAIGALELSRKGVPLRIMSDSRYVTETMTSGWARKANHDLWERLDRLVHSHGAAVSFTWVKGHSTHQFNNRADVLARRAANS